MKYLVRWADAITEWTGNIAAVCCVLLVALMFGLVVARYCFDIGSIASQEATQWLHGTAFLLALAYGLNTTVMSGSIFFRSAGQNGIRH